MGGHASRRRADRGGTRLRRRSSRGPTTRRLGPERRGNPHEPKKTAGSAKTDPAHVSVHGSLRRRSGQTGLGGDQRPQPLRPAFTPPARGEAPPPHRGTPFLLRPANAAAGPTFSSALGPAGVSSNSSADTAESARAYHLKTTTSPEQWKSRGANRRENHRPPGPSAGPARQGRDRDGRTTHRGSLSAPAAGAAEGWQPPRRASYAYGSVDSRRRL
jgi:hypothetical protein